MNRILATLIAASMASGCATQRGFDRGALRSQITEKVETTEEDIKKVLELKPQLPRPFRLGVVFSEKIDEARWQPWTWDSKDKDLMVGLAPELAGEISDVVVLNRGMIDGWDRKAIRLAAARAGADAVLVVDGIADVDAYATPLMWTYGLIIPMIFVRGAVVEALFLTTASMWDVKNDYLYLSVEAEGTVKEKAFEAGGRHPKAIEAAKSAAMQSLWEELLSRLRKLSSK